MLIFLKQKSVVSFGYSAKNTYFCDVYLQKKTDLIIMEVPI